MTDTTAPADDDLREAIAEITDHYGAADDILALIAPRIAAARAEGRREGIAEALLVLNTAVVAKHTRRDAVLGESPRLGSIEEASQQAANIALIVAIDALETAATAIRALADAPRQDAGGMTEGG